MNSLKAQVFLRVSLLILITLAVVSGLAYRSVHDSIAENYDAQLITDCNLLWLLTREEFGEKDIISEEIDAQSTEFLQPTKYRKSFEQYGDWHAFRIWKNGHIFLRSDNEYDNIPIFEEGLSNKVINGHKWRIYSLHIPNSQAVIEAFEDLDSRRVVEKSILIRLTGPLLLMIPLVGWMLKHGINSGLGSLQRFARQVERRSADDLSPVETQAAPVELKPLMVSLNVMFAKLGGLLNREREFIDNAAHALRTPISVLKVQGKLLQESSDSSERESAIKDIQAGIDRASKLIQQLLVLSKLDNQKPTLSRVDLHQCTQSALQDISPLVLDKHIDLSLDSVGSIMVTADPELLKMMILSIVENAIKYTAEHGRVKLRITTPEQYCMLEIEDNGPGIAESEHKKVFYRFYRAPSTSEQGSGLGLAIAKSIADISNATISVASPASGKGALIQVRFPL